MLFEFIFGRALRRALRDELQIELQHQGRLNREVLLAVATTIEAMTLRLAAVARRQDKTIGEIRAAKGELAGMKVEIERLRQIIANGPAEGLAELEAQLRRVEARAIAADESLPDLPEPGASPEEGASPDETGGSPDGGSPEAAPEPAPEAPARAAFP